MVDSGCGSKQRHGKLGKHRDREAKRRFRKGVEVGWGDGVDGNGRGEARLKARDRET